MDKQHQRDKGNRMAEFEYLDFDREIWEKELEDFVPPIVYDMHSHIWSETHAPPGGEAKGLRAPQDYQSHQIGRAHV